MRVLLLVAVLLELGCAAARPPGRRCPPMDAPKGCRVLKLDPNCGPAVCVEKRRDAEVTLPQIVAPLAPPVPESR